MAGPVQGPQLIDTREAEAAFGAGLGVIKGTADNQVKLPTAANEAVVGVSGLSGDPAGVGKDAQKQKPSIVMFGPVRAVAGAAVGVDAEVKVGGTNGRLVPIGGEGAGAVVNVVGRALSAAAADGDEFDLFVFRYQFTN